MVAVRDRLVAPTPARTQIAAPQSQQIQRTTEARIDETSLDNRQGTSQSEPQYDGPPAAPRPLMPTDKADSDVKTKMYFQSLRYSYIGLFFGVAVVFGYGVGSALDRRFGTGSWLTMVGVLLGVASGFNELIRLARKYQRELSQNRKTP